MRFKFKLFLTFFLTLMVQVTFAQEKIISGIVSDQSGPLPGATILIKNSFKGTETDFDGQYSLKVKEGDILVFSYVGMLSAEKSTSGLTNIDVTLEENSNVLNEIEVIATGYDKVNRKSFAGAATSINIEDLKIDGVIDVTRMLEGRIAGVNVQNISGTFGSAPKITIRGSSSIFGNNTPLYVIDGVVQEDIVDLNLDQLTSGDASTLISSSVAGINASDIKKIDILKDASATSIYGARARNGVIVITTKSGKKDSPLKLTYNLEQTMRDIPSYTNFDILDSKENISILNELEGKGYFQFPESLSSRYGGLFSIRSREINTYNTSTGEFLTENTAEGRNRFLQKRELTNTDWFKTLFRNSLMQNHSLSLSGGGESNAYYASIGFLNDPGWSIAESVKRVTANIKNTFYFSDKFNVTLATVASIRKQNAPGTFRRETDTFNGSVSREFDINPFSYVLNTSRALRARDEQGNLEYYRNNWADLNILEELENNFIEINQRDLRFQADAEYKLSDKITYNFNGAARYVNSVREHSITENSNVVRAYNADETTIIRDANIFLYDDPNDPNDTPVAVLPKGGIYIKNDNYLTSYYARNSFKYKDNFNDKNEVDLLLGQEIRHVDRSDNTYTGYGLQYSSGLTPFTDSRILEKLISDGGNYYELSSQQERTVAFFGKATYIYDDKYVFSATGRYDGSNRQGSSPSSRWLPTGTVSAKWNASKENFLADSNTISNLQFRGSYGLVATPGSATNALSIIRPAISGRLLPGDRENVLNIDELQNSELTWEKQYELNLGIDLGLFKNRVNFTADVYRRDIFDNIDRIRSSGIGGQFVKLGNNADVTTDGLELGLNTKNFTGDFKWSTNLNFSYFDQKITNSKNTPTAFNLVNNTGDNIEGYPINSLFSFQFAGLNSEGLPQFIDKDGNVNVNVNFQNDKDLTKYLKYEGSIDPNISAGFSNNFSYKNWSLSTLITASGGNKIRLNNLFKNEYSDLDAFSKDFKDRWVSPGDENTTDVPVLADLYLNERYNNNLKNTYNAYNNSSVRVADGDFIRMKNISFGYKFSKELVENLGLSHLNLRLQGSNLFLIYSDSKLNGQDPEFFQSGGVALPITRQYTFSLNLGF